MSAVGNGGSAFPARNYIVPSDLEARHVHALGATQGMTLRDYFIAHAPADEVESLIPTTVGDVARWLGVEVYDYQIHYPMALAKARCVWADAMLKAREVQP